MTTALTIQCLCPAGHGCHVGHARCAVLHRWVTPLSHPDPLYAGIAGVQWAYSQQEGDTYWTLYPRATLLVGVDGALLGTPMSPLATIPEAVLDCLTSWIQHRRLD